MEPIARCIQRVEHEFKRVSGRVFEIGIPNASEVLNVGTHFLNTTLTNVYQKKVKIQAKVKSWMDLKTQLEKLVVSLAKFANIDSTFESGSLLNPSTIFADNSYAQIAMQIRSHAPRFMKQAEDLETEFTKVLGKTKSKLDTFETDRKDLIDMVRDSDAKAVLKAWGMLTIHPTKPQTEFVTTYNKVVSAFVESTSTVLRFDRDHRHIVTLKRSSETVIRHALRVAEYISAVYTHSESENPEGDVIYSISEIPIHFKQFDEKMKSVSEIVWLNTIWTPRVKTFMHQHQSDDGAVKDLLVVASIDGELDTFINFVAAQSLFHGNAINAENKRIQLYVKNTTLIDRIRKMKLPSKGTLDKTNTQHKS